MPAFVYILSEVKDILFQFNELILVVIFHYYHCDLHICSARLESLTDVATSVSKGQ